MQHPHTNSNTRTPELLRRAQTVLAVTARDYGLACVQAPCPREDERPAPERDNNSERALEAMS